MMRNSIFELENLLSDRSRFAGTLIESGAWKEGALLEAHRTGSLKRNSFFFSVKVGTVAFRPRIRLQISTISAGTIGISFPITPGGSLVCRVNYIRSELGAKFVAISRTSERIGAIDLSDQFLTRRMVNLW